MAHTLDFRTAFRILGVLMVLNIQRSQSAERSNTSGKPPAQQAFTVWSPPAANTNMTVLQTLTDQRSPPIVSIIRKLQSDIEKSHISSRPRAKAVTGYPDIVMKYGIEMTNNGPVILGASAIFVATVKAQPKADGQAAHQFQEADKFLFIWSGQSNFLPQIMIGNATCRLSIPFETQPGVKMIKVTVMPTGTLHEIGGANSTIQVTETINGGILASSSSYPECHLNNSDCTMPTKANVSLTAAIYDPSSFFEGAVVLYEWDMGNGVTFVLKAPVLTYSYQARGVYNVTCKLTAVLPNQPQKYGSWSRIITVLDAITNLTITSSASVEVGNRETVNITCNGSPPIDLCLTIIEPSSQASNDTNTTCETILGEKCHAELAYHFRSSGTYTLKVAAMNNVSFAANVSAIHAYTPAITPQSITEITLAIIAGLSMTILGVTAFMQHVHKNRQRHVEVANFDFQSRDHSDSFRWKHSIFRWSRSSGEKKSLLNRVL